MNAATRLQCAGFEDSRIEAEVLFQFSLGWTKAHLYAGLQESIARAEVEALRQLVERRLAHEPSAYIVGQREFYGLDLEVTPDVLIPRPETELLVEEALIHIKARHQTGFGVTVADVGTGSGAIALALAAHLKDVRVFGLDVSPAALNVAQRNVDRLGLASSVQLQHGDLLKSLAAPLDLIAANLPYVRSGDRDDLAPDIRDFEPAIALYGGESGTDVVERLLATAGAYLRPNGVILLEIGYGQATSVLELTHRYLRGYGVSIRKDFAGIDRIAVIET